MVTAVPVGVVGATKQTQSTETEADVQASAAEQAYKKYKATQQKENTSSGIKYTSNENPEYYGKQSKSLETARDVLAKRDQQTKEQPTFTYEQRAGEQEKSYEPIIKQSNSVPPITPRQQNAIDFHLQEIERVRFLEAAKKQGVTSIDLYNEKGEKVGSTNPQDVTKASYDILQASIKTKGVITYQYKTQSKEYSLNLTEGGVKKETVPQQDNEVASFLKFPFIGQKVSSETIPSTSIFNMLQFVPLGGGLISKIYDIPIEKAITFSKTQSTISRIETALREDNLIIGTEKTANTKVVQISQGTIGKSGIESFKPERAPINKENFKLSPGAEETEKPPPPPNIKEKETILTVGRQGEAKPVQVPTTITLDQSLEGQAKVPVTFYKTGEQGFIKTQKEGIIVLARSEPQESLPPNAVLVIFQGISKEDELRQVAFYGLKETQEKQGAYYGKLTPELVEKLNFDIKGQAVKTGTDLFEFKEKDFLNNEKLYAKATQNPEILESNNLPSVVRPFVIRTFEAKGYTKSTLLERQTERQTKIPENPLFPQQDIEIIKERYPLMTSHETSTEPKLEIGKKSEEAINSIKNILGREETKTEVKASQNKIIETDYVFEILNFKPETSKSDNQRLYESAKTQTNNLSLNKPYEQSEILNTNIIDILNKPTQKESTKNSIEETLGIISGQISKQTPKQIQPQLTEQITKQQTKQIEELVTGNTPPPTRLTTGIPETGFNLLFNEKKDESKNKKKGGKSILFLGNAPQMSIVGLYKREDIITNEKKINQLTKKEQREENKPYKEFEQKNKKFKLNRENKVTFISKEKKKTKGFKF